MFKLIIEKIKRKSHKKKQKSEPSSPEDIKLIPESEHSEADEEAIRVQLWRDAQVSRAIQRTILLSVFSDTRIIVIV